MDVVSAISEESQNDCSERPRKKKRVSECGTCGEIYTVDMGVVHEIKKECRKNGTYLVSWKDSIISQKDISKVTLLC